MTASESEVDAVLLDLFGVVIAFDNDIVYRRLADRCADPERAMRDFDGLMAGRDVITGKLTLEDVHRRLVAAHGLTLDMAGFTDAWMEPYSWSMPGMAELIGDLAAGPARLLLLSNIDGYYWELVRSMQPELGLFDELLLSCDLGMAKPDEEIFRHACETAGSPPQRCVFVDDTAVNVDAAVRIGLHGHVFRDAPTLRAELAARGVSGV